MRHTLNSRLSTAGMRLRRSAFTMLEMIIVLSILAVLTTVAVQSLEPLSKQSRVDATQKTLDELRAAIVGRPTNTTDVNASAPSFVADVGRLPMSIDELFMKMDGLADFHSGALAGDDSDVTVARGWRGPYMRLPAGATMLRDGWGNPFAFDTSNGLTVASLGSDYALGGPDTYSKDLGFSLPLTTSADSFYGESISGSILELVGGQWVAPTTGTGETLTIQVRLFAPDHVVPPIDADGVAEFTQTPDAPTYRYAFNKPVLGPRVVKATLERTSPGDPDPDSGAPTTVTTKKKASAAIIVRAGSLYVVDLRLQ
ncbi:MAG: prepilin-type N-terminal cleavage/methylation domain-containing protein [Planctomycetia bacterium]|nr:prepilin-type N-terminal cleavage/methylation domain-containing protein [Planctomycetia bacterium]